MPAGPAQPRYQPGSKTAGAAVTAIAEVRSAANPTGAPLGPSRGHPHAAITAGTGNAA
jgi:hypothetical protein